MSETVKVLCYRYKTLSNGEHPLMIRVSKDGKKKYKSLGLSIKASFWDFNTNEPKPKCPNRNQLMILINEKLNEIQKAALESQIAGKDYTATTLMESTNKTKSKKTVGELYKAYIQTLKDNNRIRYAGMFEVSYASFIKFNKHLDIPFFDIDVNWLKRYETWATKAGLSSSTIYTRLRHLRVVYNQALLDNVVKPECYPFKKYRLSKLNRKTPHRAIEKTDIIKILSYKGKGQMECLAIDIFAFSYLTAGINFIDICKLRQENIIDNKITYVRSKTKKLITIPIQKNAMDIITKYKSESQYIFPILNATHKTETQIANRLHKILAKLNKHLREIGEKLNLPIKLTTYVARHSFATVLKRSGVSTSIISESLGHSSERITQTYLDSFENSQINNAMQHLL